MATTATFERDGDDEKRAALPTEISSDNEDGFEDQDIAIGVVGEHAHAIDPAVEARVLRKIDLYLIPAMSIGYGLVYYDKVHQSSSSSSSRTVSLSFSTK
jgi:hypothetical protein